MSEIRVASRYAKSLIELADEKGVLDEVHENILLLQDTCDGSVDLRLMLKNPIISREAKLNVLRRIFEGKINKLTLSFFEILTKKQREDLLYVIAKEFHAQYNEKMQIESALVTTPFELTAELRAALQAEAEKIAGKKVDLKEKVNPELIGGFILQVRDRQIDTSINSRLKELRVKFSENPYIREF
ncbi:MAG: ATP synthase F1 subunit delta [Cytophagales bacterium]|nr:MAG: ATP synthase F1 subunit delta [Cytophagales bacterium]